MDDRIERQPSELAPRRIAEPIRGKCVSGLMHRQRSNQDDQNDEDLGEIYALH